MRKQQWLREAACAPSNMSTRWGSLKTTHIAVVQRQGGVRGAKLIVLLLGDRHGAKETVARENQFKPEKAETHEYLQRGKPHLHTICCFHNVLDGGIL